MIRINIFAKCSILNSNLSSKLKPGILINNSTKIFFVKSLKPLLILGCLTVIWPNILAQTRGMIVNPATSNGQAILDPDKDGYVSVSGSGFINNDQAESEIPYVAIVFPNTEPTSDVRNGANCGFTDFVDSGTEDACQQYVDSANNWLFRLRMANLSAAAKSYSILIDTDGKFGNTGPDADSNYSSSNPGFEIEIVLATKFGVYVYDVNSMNCTPVISYTGTTNYQKSIAHSSICNSYNYFLDFFVDIDDFTIASTANGSTANLFPGVTSSTTMRMAVVSNMAASKSTLCNISSASDIGGVGDCPNIETCFNTIIDNYPPCTPGLVCLDRSSCPTITSPISAGATSISGTSAEATGTKILVFKNGSIIDTTTVSSGAWTLSSIASVTSSDTITASAIASGKSESKNNCSTTIVGATCTDPVDTVYMCNSSKAFTGTGKPGAAINIYSGFSTTPETPTSGNVWSGSSITVSSTDSSFLWRCIGSGQTLSCTAGGGPCVADGVYRVTQKESGSCESDPYWVCVGLKSATATPVVSTTPITDTTTIIGGTAVASSTVILYSDDSQIGTATADGSGSWTISSLSLTTGSSITAKALATGSCVSNASTGVLVSGNTDAPTLNSPYCTATTIDTVTGTSNEPSGTYIIIYENGVKEGDTTTVLSDGSWVATSGISIAKGSTITAKAMLVNGLLSAASNSVTVGTKTGNAVAITTSPITDGAGSISGTGTNSDVVYLYVDGFYTGNTTTVSSGTWTISGLASYVLYSGGSVTVTVETPGNCQSDPSTAVTVVCITPLSTTVVDPADTTICSGSIAADVRVLATENLVVYQLYNGSNATGNSILGDGSTKTLSSDTLTSSTTLKVKALKIDGTTCEILLTDTMNVTVNALPVTNLTVGVSSNPVCSGSSANVTIASSVLNNTYQLYNQSTDATIGTAVTGTGGTISLPTGALSTNTSFYIIVTGPGTSFCSDTMDTKPSITVTSIPSQPGIITGPSAPCKGATGLMYSISAVSGASSYTWTVPTGSSITAGQGSISITASIDTTAGNISVVTNDGTCSSVARTLTINPIACPPNTTSDTLIINEDSSNIIIKVQGNDSDPGGFDMTTTIVSGPSSGGTVTVSNSDSLIYTPKANFNGIDTIVYKVCNSLGACAVDTVYITVNAVNDEPGKGNENWTVTEDAASTTSSSLIANNSDPEGTTLKVTTIVSSSGGGTTSITGSGSTIDYKPALNFNGIDTVIYTVCDSGLPLPAKCVNDTLFVTVNAVNDEPGKGNENWTVTEDTSSAVSMNLTSNNIDPDSTTTKVKNIVSSTGVGSITINADSLGITYTPATNFSGIDTVIYTVCDSGAPLPIKCVNDTLFITVTAVNDEPTKGNEIMTVSEDAASTTSSSLIANNSDPEGTTLKVTTIVSSSGGGTTSITGSGSTIDYKPALNFNGIDTVIYTVCDSGVPLPALCVTDTLFITVTAVNDTMTQGNEYMTMLEDAATTTSPSLIANNIDPDSSKVTVTSIISNTGGGTYTISGMGTTIDYTPALNFNGIDTVLYSVCDSGVPLPVICVTDTLFITVTAVNDTMTQGNEYMTMLEDAATTTSPSLIANNIDPDSSKVTVTSIISNTGGGTYTISGMGTTIDYTPALNFNGIDTVLYSVCDSGVPLPVICVTDTLFITVTAVNDTMTQGNEYMTMLEDAATTTSPSLIANNIDPDSSKVTVTSIISNTGGGTYTISVTGTTIDYTPALNFNGIDTVLYSVCDSGVPLPVICFTDTLFITVTAVNDLPVAVDSSGNTLETIYRTTKVNTPINICIDALDVERDTLDVISSFNGPTNGSTSGLANGDTCFTYVPNSVFIGNDSLFITLCDSGGCDTVLVYIKVTPLTPKAKNYSVKVNNGKIKVLILENDSNPGGGKLTVSIVTFPAGGPATFDSTGITYTPSIDFCGMDSLQYKVCNEQGLCDSAWIYFTVIPIDSDKDGIPDYLETRTSDSDEDGVLDYLSLDSDGDGILDRIEALGNLDDPCNVVLADCDSDGTPDYKDPKNCTLIIRVPKGFSPNGDGANDLFIIPGLDEYPNNSITIFNRWGNKIFEAAPYENNWGGKSENGATVGEGALPEGTYFFLLELSPDEKPIKSYIYLKR